MKQAYLANEMNRLAAPVDVVAKNTPLPASYRALTQKSRDRLNLLLLENMRRFVTGEPMLSVTDVERGY